MGIDSQSAQNEVEPDDTETIDRISLRFYPPPDHPELNAYASKLRPLVSAPGVTAEQRVRGERFTGNATKTIRFPARQSMFVDCAVAELRKESAWQARDYVECVGEVCRRFANVPDSIATAVYDVAGRIDPDEEIGDLIEDTDNEQSERSDGGESDESGSGWDEE